MKSNKSFLIVTTFVLYASISCAQNNTPKIESPQNINYSYELISDGFEIPWGMCFISKNDFLATEKSGTMYRIRNGVKNKISGLPEVYLRGQGGLMDVCLHPNFKENNLIYFTSSSSLGEENGGNTALYRAVLKNNKLEKLKLLYKGKENSKKGQHFGSRIIFDNNGYLFFSIGDRGNRDVNPQDLNRDGGKIYRLTEDGEIPKDNPFSYQEITKKAIYSFGHRNTQGMVKHYKTGEIWTHEHGPRGGDEINIIEAGKNYGWPEITYGINYSGTTITDKTSSPGMEQPLYYWVPSIAPSGMAFSSSGIYPEWKDNLFVGSLKFNYLERLVLKDKKVIKREKILENIGGKVRNVIEGPDGFLYVGVDGKGIIKILPK